MGSGRGISTVVDVAMALFLITASIGIVAAYLNQQDAPEYDPKTDSRTAETLSATTTSVQYSVEPVTDHPQFDEDEIWGADRSDYDVNYQRSAHGTSAALMADAAVTNVRFADGFTTGSTHGLLTKQGEDYSRAVDASVRDTLTGANNDTQIIAVWQPYERAPIEGRQTFGRAPPPDADVSSTTLTVACRIPAIDDDEVERRYRTDGYEGVSELVADAIVEGYFPPEETQLSLEGNGLERQLAVYRYVRMGEFVGDTFTPGNWFGAGPINGDADAGAANDQVADDLANMIEDDMESSAYYDDDTSAEEISDRVSTGHVEIVVRTW